MVARCPGSCESLSYLATPAGATVRCPIRTGWHDVTMDGGDTGSDRRIVLARIYESAPEGYRVLVDRLWPRGVSREEAALDEWLKDVAPSTDLRKWYGHRVGRFAEFERRYLEELGHPTAQAAADHVLEIAASRPVVLLTAARDVEHSGAGVLLGFLSTRRQQ